VDYLSLFHEEEEDVWRLFLKLQKEAENGD
jgi:hypothetical protein